MAEGQRKLRLSQGYRSPNLCYKVSKRTILEQPVAEGNNSAVMKNHQGVAGSQKPNFRSTAAKFEGFFFKASPLFTSESTYCGNCCACAIALKSSADIQTPRMQLCEN